MGLNFLNSSSSYDEPKTRTIYETVTKLVKVKGNPNPKNFKVTKQVIVNGYLVARVTYPDSKNYEGVKILLYDKGITIDDLLKQGSIDPHFSDNKKFLSPIARFVPTSRGWNMAIKLAKTLK